MVLMISLKLGENEANEATNPHPKTVLTLISSQKIFFLEMLNKEMLLLQADHIEEKPIVNLNFLLDAPYSRVILINLED